MTTAKTIKLKAALDNFDQASKDTGLKCTDPTLAQQHFKEECDINTLVEQFRLTGEMPQLQRLPTYEDYEDVFDFQTAMNTVRMATETFMSLPAQLRARFHNDPQEFLAFTSDAQNLPEARKLGILSDEALKRLDEAAQADQRKREAEIIENHEKTKASKTKPGKTPDPS